MLPSRLSSAASSHRRYEGTFLSSDHLYVAGSSIGERPQIHDDRAMKYELGDVTLRPSLAVFASSENVLPIPPLRWPSHHPAPNCGGVCSIHITSLRDHPNHSNCHLHLRRCRTLSPRRHLSSTPCSRPIKFYEGIVPMTALAPTSRS